MELVALVIMILIVAYQQWHHAQTLRKIEANFLVIRTKVDQIHTVLAKILVSRRKGDTNERNTQLS